MTWVVWSLLSAAFAAATAILAKVAVSQINSNLATAIRTSVILLITWAIALATRTPGWRSGLSLRTLIFLGLSGLATGLSWLCYFRALQLGPASRVAPLDKLSVVLVIAFSALFLAEPLTRAKIIGGLFIVAGAIIIALE